MKDDKKRDANGVKDNSLFRKKSLERLQSPENLNEYIKVANPGMWIILVAIIVFLAGGIVWCLLGSLKVRVPAAVVTENGSSICYVSEINDVKVRPGMELEIGDEIYILGKHKDTLAEFDLLDDFGRDVITAVGAQNDSVVCYAYEVSTNGADGFYDAYIVVEEIAPLSLLFER